MKWIKNYLCFDKNYTISSIVSSKGPEIKRSLIYDVTYDCPMVLRQKSCIKARPKKVKEVFTASLMIIAA